MNEKIEIIRKTVSFGVITLELAIWYDPDNSKILKVEYIAEESKKDV
jgi:hypothetical protein